MYEFKYLAIYSFNCLFMNTRETERVPFKGGLQTAQNMESTGTQSIKYFFPHTERVDASYEPSTQLASSFSFIEAIHPIQLYSQRLGHDCCSFTVETELDLDLAPKYSFSSNKLRTGCVYPKITKAGFNKDISHTASPNRT